MSTNSNQLNIPLARETGSIGGQMVKNNVSHTKYEIRQTYPYYSWTYQNCGAQSHHFYIKRDSLLEEVPFDVISQMQFYAG